MTDVNLSNKTLSYVKMLSDYIHCTCTVHVYRWSCSVSFLFHDKSELNTVKSVAVALGINDEVSKCHVMVKSLIWPWGQSSKVTNNGTRHIVWRWSTYMPNMQSPDTICYGCTDGRMEGQTDQYRASATLWRGPNKNNSCFPFLYTVQVLNLSKSNFVCFIQPK